MQESKSVIQKIEEDQQKELEKDDVTHHHTKLRKKYNRDLTATPPRNQRKGSDDEKVVHVLKQTGTHADLKTRKSKVHKNEDHAKELKKNDIINQHTKQRLKYNRDLTATPPRK